MDVRDVIASEAKKSAYKDADYSVLWRPDGYQAGCRQ